MPVAPEFSLSYMVSTRAVRAAAEQDPEFRKTIRAGYNGSMPLIPALDLQLRGQPGSTECVLG